MSIERTILKVKGFTLVFKREKKGLEITVRDRKGELIQDYNVIRHVIYEYIAEKELRVLLLEEQEKIVKDYIIPYFVDDFVIKQLSRDLIVLVNAKIPSVSIQIKMGDNKALSILLCIKTLECVDKRYLHMDLPSEVFFTDNPQKEIRGGLKSYTTYYISNLVHKGGIQEGIQKSIQTHNFKSIIPTILHSIDFRARYNNNGVTFKGMFAD